MALATAPSTPPSTIAIAAPNTTFDISSHYNNLRTQDPPPPPAIAAIESLIALLSSNPLITISETLALLSHQSQILLSSQKNPIPLSAGTDLFQRYLASSFQARSTFQHHGQPDFTTLRNQLIGNSKLFVSRAKQAPRKIAKHGLPFIRDDSVVFTYGDSSVVKTLLSHANDTGRFFTTIIITSPSSPSAPPNAKSATSSNPTKSIPLHALSYTLSSLPSKVHRKAILVLPATAVLESGATISALGTQSLAILAQHFHIPVYVAVESYTFVREFPLGAGSADLAKIGVHQDLLDLPSTSADWPDDGDEDKLPKNQKQSALVSKHSDAEKSITEEKDMIEIVPANLISALITENGVMTTAAVSEELIKLWF